MRRRAIYREDGGEFLVDVVSDQEIDTDDGLFRRVKLRCIETAKPSPFFGSLDPGEEFEVSVRRGYESSAGWTLNELS